MKKNVVSVFTLLPLFCLSSCSNKDFVYPDCVDVSKDYILSQNGDGYVGISTYEDVEKSLKKTTSSELIKRVNKGEDVLFLFSSNECSSCLSFLPKAISDISYLNLSIDYINEDFFNEASIIKNYVGEHNITKRLGNNYFSGSTPSMYLFNDTCLTEVFYGGSSSETISKTIIASLKEFTSLSGINIYTKPNKFSGLSYLVKKDSESLDFYYEHIYPLAKESKNIFNLIYIDNMTKEEKEELKGSLSLDDVEEGTIINEKKSLHFKDEGALKFIEEYYPLFLGSDLLIKG